MPKTKLTSSKQTTFETSKTPSWGFKTFSEKINGRAAMIGFILLLLIEVITKKKVL